MKFKYIFVIENSNKTKKNKTKCYVVTCIDFKLCKKIYILVYKYFQKYKFNKNNNFKL